MQEEVTNRSVNLAITTTKLTGRAILKGLRQFLTMNENLQAKLTAIENEPAHGKMTVQELIGKDQGVSTIPVAKTELKGFERVAKKYGVDFAIKKDESVIPSRYTVFFKARDNDALLAAYKEYTAQALNKQKRPSVLKKLKELAEKVASLPKKTRQKAQEQEL